MSAPSVVPPKNLSRQTSDVCYTNATVRRKEVAQFLKRKRKKTKKNIDDSNENDDDDPISLSAEVHNVLRVLWSGKWAVFTPYSLVFSLWHFVPQFRSYLQQDAQEFYNFFIDAVNTELLQIAKKADDEMKRLNNPLLTNITDNDIFQSMITTTSNSNSNGSKNTEVAALIKISCDAKKFVSTGFQGMSGDEIQCLSCDSLSKNQQMFVSLSIPIPYQYKVKSKVVSSLKKIKTSIKKKEREEKKKKKNQQQKSIKNQKQQAPKDPISLSSRDQSNSSYGSASVRAARPRIVSSVGIQTSSSSSSLSKGSNNNDSCSSRATRRRKLCLTSCTIQDCLASAHATERLVGDSQYHCVKCGCKRDATKRGVISSLPRVLVSLFFACCDCC
jgi:ubiquitin C-terminal hydrolase